MSRMWEWRKQVAREEIASRPERNRGKSKKNETKPVKEQQIAEEGSKRKARTRERAQPRPRLRGEKRLRGGGICQTCGNHRLGPYRGWEYCAASNRRLVEPAIEAAECEGWAPAGAVQPQ